MDLCLACERDLPILQNYCKRCAEPLPEGQKICGSCLGDLSMQIETTALFNYSSPIDQLIINLKFRNNLIGARILGELLGNHLHDQYQNKSKPEIIIPVPLYSARLRERGYNQASLIARPLAMGSGIPYSSRVLMRTRETRSQVGLSIEERRENVHAAFVAQWTEVVGQSILVVDDVATSGATLDACAEAILNAGGRSVYGLTVSRAARPGLDVEP